MAISKITTKTKILQAAFAELIEKGFSRFTIQGVAARTEISLGNLTYHFPNREQLIQAMIDQWFETWRVEFDRVVSKKIAKKNPNFSAFIEWVMDYALVKENVRTFTELWAIGNHEPKVAKMLDKLYDQAVNSIIEALGLPPAAKQSAEMRSLLYVLAALSEGSTAVLGNAPKNHPQRKILKKRAAEILAPLFGQALQQTKSGK